jgi:calcineurin-like phosphoesterase family protein
MNDQLIKNWNYWIKKDDIVYHLGDFVLGNQEKIKSIISQLQGRIFLLLGNHDRYKPTVYMQLGIEWCCRFPIIYDSNIILSHYPIPNLENTQFKNFHGHTHEKNYGDPKYYYNCSVENNEYLPVNWNTIKEKMKSC